METFLGALGAAEIVEYVEQTGFEEALEALLEIEMPMGEDGAETGDAFFIHE